MKIAFLWKDHSGYFDACLRALAAQPDVEVALAYRTPAADAPFDRASFTSAHGAMAWSGEPDEQELERFVDGFAPDVVVVSSWDITAYRKLMARRKGRYPRVLGMDNQWLGTPKQRAAQAIARWYLHPSYDYALVAGDTSAAFARRLGFRDSEILRPFYSCDYTAFSAIGDSRGATIPRRFVFVGRLVPEKGVDVLAEAYARYAATVPDPWPLVVCGRGELSARLEGVPGVEMAGFTQPADLPALMGTAGCLVLPSRFEPWGVVLHEAAAAGLAIIATPDCGASTRMLQDGYNGRLVEAGSADDLVRGLQWVSARSDAQLAGLSQASTSLARQCTPELWATSLVDRFG